MVADTFTSPTSGHVDFFSLVNLFVIGKNHRTFVLSSDLYRLTSCARAQSLKLPTASHDPIN